MNRLEIFEQMFESDPSNTMVLFGIAKEYEKLGRYEEVVRALEGYLADVDDEGNAYGTLANAYAVLGDREKAIETYKRGIEVAMDHGHPSLANEFRMTLDLDFGD